MASLVFCTAGTLGACGSDGTSEMGRHPLSDAGLNFNSGSGGATQGKGGMAASPGSGGRGGAGGLSSSGGASTAQCRSSLQCAGRTDGLLICDPAKAQCVECVTAADCTPGASCVLDRCHPACQSDKECTQLGMVCGTAGQCVDCKVDADCAPGKQCFDATCIGSTCTPGQSRCSSTGIASCLPTGDGWGTPTPCPNTESCIIDAVVGARCGSVGAGGMTGAGGALGAGGSGGTCRPSYCPSSGSGTPCCQTSGACGIDYGMGCTAIPRDAGAGGALGAGGKPGAGGSTGTDASPYLPDASTTPLDASVDPLDASATVD